MWPWFACDIRTLTGDGIKEKKKTQLPGCKQYPSFWFAHETIRFPVGIQWKDQGELCIYLLGLSNPSCQGSMSFGKTVVSGLSLFGFDLIECEKTSIHMQFRTRCCKGKWIAHSSSTSQWENSAEQRQGHPRKEAVKSMTASSVISVHSSVGKQRLKYENWCNRLAWPEISRWKIRPHCSDVLGLRASFFSEWTFSKILGKKNMVLHAGLSSASKVRERIREETGQTLTKLHACRHACMYEHNSTHTHRVIRTIATTATGN